MTADAPTSGRPHKRLFDRLGTRLAVMIALAMLPLGLLGVVQTRNLVDEAETRSRLAVMGATVQAAGPEIRLIRQTQAMSRTLAQTIQPYVRDPATCTEMARLVAEAEPALSLVAFIPLSGKMTCASTGKPYDFSNHPLFLKMSERPEPAIVLNPRGPVSGTSIVAIAHPVFNAAGRHIGIISMSIPHSALAKVRAAQEAEPGAKSDLGDPVSLITFDRTGQILTSSLGMERDQVTIPKDRALEDLATQGMQSFIGTSRAGLRRVFSVVPLTEDLFLLGTWPIEEQWTVLGVPVRPFVFPVAMWMAGMLVALLATETLVTRHMRRLGAAMNAFAAGNRIPGNLQLDQSPAEIRALGHAYGELTNTILRDEAELENLLRQKEMLLREIHHRTGNSLQLIASILRLHLREEQSPAVREVLTSLHDRVIGLATVHLGLYKTAGQADVRMDELFEGVIRQISVMRRDAERGAAIETQLDPIRLIPDQAVPLSLLLAEVISGFPTRDLAPDRSGVRVALRLTAPGTAELRICGPATGRTDAAGSSLPVPTLIGSQLVRGFAQQLGGTLDIQRKDDRLEVGLSFPVRDALRSGAADALSAVA
jgi:two-component sensor histidine kinase